MSEKSSKSVPSGTLAQSSRPVHEHGLRATAARNAHQARESTHSTLPTKRKLKNWGVREIWVSTNPFVLLQRALLSFLRL